MLEEFPLPVDVGVKKIPQETDGRWLKMVQQAIEAYKIPVKGFAGHCRTEFAEMADLPEVYIAHHQGVFAFPVQCPPGMEFKPLTAEFCQMRHLSKGIKCEVLKELPFSLTG